MEFRHLRYFIAVAEALHFSAAAEQLGIAAPTLTVQIQALERELRARLLHRSRRGVALTAAGEAFLVEARHAVAQLERARSVGQRAGRGEIGRIEIGYVGSAVYGGLLQAQVRRFREAWPEVELVASEQAMHELPGMIEQGRIDVGFLRLPMPLPPALLSHTLLHDVFCVALPSAHRLAAERLPLPARALAGETFVLPEQPLGTYEVGRRGRFTPRIGAVPGSLVAVLGLVSLGAGVSVMPGVVREALRLPGTVFRQLAGKPITSSVAAVFRRHEASAAVGRFIAQLRATEALAPRARPGAT